MLNFKLSHYLTVYRLYIRYVGYLRIILLLLDALSDAVALKSFRCEGKVLSKHLTKKNSSTITEVEYNNFNMITS